MKHRRPRSRIRETARSVGGRRSASLWIAALAVLGASCVDLTPPWNGGADRDAPPSSGVGSELEDGPGRSTDPGFDSPGSAPGPDSRDGGYPGIDALVESDGPALDATASDSPPSDLDDSRNAVDSSTVPPADGRADAVGDADAHVDGRDGALDAAGTGGRTGRGGASGSGGTRATGGNGGSGISATGGNAVDGALATGGTATGSGGASGASSGSGGTLSGSGGAGSGGSGGPSSGDAAFGCTANVPPGAADHLGEALVAYYQCEPATLTALPDSSGNSADGTLVTGTGGNAGFSYGPGRIGQAVTLSAAQAGYATLPSTLLADAQETTVATWVYINSAIDWQRIFDFGKGESDGTAKVYMYLAASEDVHGYLHFAISTTGPGSSEQSMDGPVLSTKTWHHVAVVLGASGGVLYVDGCRVGANSQMTLRPADLPHPLSYYIGLSQWTRYPVHLDAAIDEFRVYSRALSSEEIQALAGGV